MKEWRTDWAEIEKKVEGIVKDCEHFEMDPPEFPTIPLVRAELQSEVQTQKQLLCYLFNNISFCCCEIF